MTTLTEFLRSKGINIFYAAGNGVVAFRSASLRDRAREALRNDIESEHKSASAFCFRLKDEVRKNLTYKGESF